MEAFCDNSYPDSLLPHKKSNSLDWKSSKWTLKKFGGDAEV